MEVRFLNVKANNVIFHKVGNTYTEYKVESIIFERGKMTSNGKYLYNGVPMQHEDMFTRNEDGTFYKAELEQGYLQDRLRYCYIYHNGEVYSGRAELYAVDLTNGMEDWYKKSKFWFISEDGELEKEVPSKDIYFSEGCALESVDTIINNLDGTTEVKKGILELIQLEEDQKRLVGVLKSVLEK